MGGAGMSYEILLGDCIASMRGLPDQSVHTCVTSPPYFGLRDYGMDGQIGLEATPDAFVARLVEVFREVRRVLRDDGTLWLNLGDSYASSTKGSGGGAASSTLQMDGRREEVRLAGAERGNARARFDARKMDCGIPDKNLLGIPWRVAFALQADGWYLRQDIIWSKPNPMPESVRDRCTKAHEYLFLLSKSDRYFFDADAIKEPAAESSLSRLAQNVEAQAGSTRVPGKTNGTMRAVGGETRNRRSVWTVTTKPFKGAHFATFPPDLIEPCILAGSPVGGIVLDPFGGSGTTAGVAMKHGRKAILCELNPAYAALMPERILSIAGDTPDMLMRAAE
jgi:DNA modification methylase